MLGSYYTGGDLKEAQKFNLFFLRRNLNVKGSALELPQCPDPDPNDPCTFDFACKKLETVTANPEETEKILSILDTDFNNCQKFIYLTDAANDDLAEDHHKEHDLRDQCYILPKHTHSITGFDTIT